MESFVNAVCSKAYAKACNAHSELSKIQASPIAEFDDVSKKHKHTNKKKPTRNKILKIAC